MSNIQCWDLENNVVTVNDELFRYDMNAHNSIVNSKPWVKDVHYFKYIRISAVALLKMVTHSRSGGNLEVMGMLFGKVTHNTMIVMDSVALPVEGTETRVNAQSDAYEFITSYKDTVAKIGRAENVIGWYHSHPGYGCWLSGIDVTTQTTNQTFQDPFVAVVIDPVRTVSSGKVNIGAFRTYPRNYSPPDQTPSEYQSIPLNKIEDFGVHCKQYYPLVTSYFKSSLDKAVLDILWNRYWTSTLTSASILSQPDYMAELTKDLAEKVANADRKLCQSGMHKFDIEEEASKVSKDAAKLANEELAGLMGQLIKYDVFNS